MLMVLHCAGWPEWLNFRTLVGSISQRCEQEPVLLGTPHPRSDCQDLGGKAGRQALPTGDRGTDNGVANEPLPGYISAWSLDLLPARSKGHSPQAGQVLDYICQRFDYPP